MAGEEAQRRGLEASPHGAAGTAAADLTAIRLAGIRPVHATPSAADTALPGRAPGREATAAVAIQAEAVQVSRCCATASRG